MSDDLERDAFPVRRRAARAAAPPYTTLARRGRPRARPTAFTWLALAAALAAVAVPGRRLVQGRLDARAAREVARALGPFAGTSWRSPTDTLLATPGRAVLLTVPAIGVAVDSLRPHSPSPVDSGDKS